MLVHLPDPPLRAIAAFGGPCALARSRRVAARLAALPCLQLLPELWEAHVLSAGRLTEQKLMKIVFLEHRDQLDMLWLGLAALPADRDGATAVARCLKAAVLVGGVATVELLLAMRASADRSFEGDTGTRLLDAVALGHAAVVHALLRASADPNHAVQDGLAHGNASLEHPLELACRAGRLSCVEALLRGRADANFVSYTTVDGQTTESTPLLVACDRAQPEVFEALLRAGADPDAVCEDPSMETGARSVRDTLAWMMGAGDARQFRAFGTHYVFSPENLHCMYDALAQTASSAPPCATQASDAG